MAKGGLTLSVKQQNPISLDANLECSAGELLALVGPSGAGKSTLLRIIAGLTHPEAGRVQCGSFTWLDTKNQVQVRAQRRRVGFVFQQYALFPHLNARENVEQACRHLPTRQRQERASYWLARVNLEGLENRRPNELSGGQMQRVGLARALAREPDVLLLDEPFSAVDRATRERLYRELAMLRTELKIPAILVTHDLDEAIMLADKLCMLSQGVTLQCGSVEHVTSRPVSVLVARLVGFKNVFRGTVVKQKGADGGVIEWRGHTLDVDRLNGFSVGDAVHWCIPQSHVVMHRHTRPSRGERENPLTGVISELLSMGDNKLVAAHLGKPDRPPVYFSVPKHVADRNALAVGEVVKFSVLATSIHLMPPDRVGRSRR